jgi:RNA polymerase sigma-70 factor (ECF subfamily)
MPSQQTISTLIEQRERFLHFIRRRVRDSDLAEDLLQAAYVRAIEQASALRQDVLASAWFFRILRNAITDHYRHRSVEERVLKPFTPEHDPPVQPEATKSTLCHCIDRALNNVKPAYRQILRATDLADEKKGSLGSFATTTGISAGNAAVRAHRARHALHRQLLRHCGSCATASCLNCTCN